jgi:spore coat polysaccharide biosynthesis protein SpsF (cytidylyltransferase family)
MNAVAIVQARVGSSRLPGKVLADLAGKPMLLRVVERVGRARSIARVVVATSRAAGDDAIAALCAGAGVSCSRGSEEDVLSRYADAARAFGADPVVRITADCPLIDPGIVDRVVGAYAAGGVDYASNIDPPSFPDGLDVEVFSAAALAKADGEARLRSEREHVTLYIRNHPESFRKRNVDSGRDLSSRRWTVDEPADLAVARAIYERLGSQAFGMDEVLRLLEDEPEIARGNAGIARDEGLAKSLREDGVVR